MAINFPNSPSNGATHTAAGQTFTYDGTAGVWNPPAAAGNAAITTDGSTPSLASGITGAEVRTLISAGESAARTAVYANIAALPTSGTAGDMAYVTATNRLYIWTGTGWYNIALINNNPTISGVSSSYALAIDGTATTVTITATDPEGLPITYNIVSDTSGNTATVAQGTGSSTNVFTITPSTNTAHAGTFSLTFRASDGVNIASAAASFTLQFKVVNQKYTTALITSVGANNAVNTSFDDKSTSNHTITANGDAHQTTFSPYRHGGYSMEFDGTGDWIDTPNHADFDLDGEFTIEFWVYIPNSYARTVQRVIAPNSGGYGTAPYISIGNDTGITGGPAMAGVLSATRAVGAGNPQMHANQTGTSATGTATLIPLNTWTHCALTRDSSNVVRMFQAGTLVATNTDTNDFDFTYGNTVGARIGRSGWGAGETLGPANLKDFRIIKGTCLYTSNFTAPTETLTAVTNTKLLIFNKPYLKDEGETGHALTVSGDPTMAPWGPFDKLEYSAASHGGSISLDGTGDSISAASSADLGFGTGDFSIEWWTYFDAISNYPYQIDMRSADNDTGLALFTRTNLGNELGVYVSASVIAAGTKSFKPNTWTHYAICKTGGYLKGYMNGVQDFSIACTRDYGSSKAIRIGAVYGNGNYFVDGNIADVRIVKGTATRTGNFTPPTTPLTAITNTKLLVQSTDAGIIDKAQTPRFVKLLGNTKSSTTQTKFLSSSMYFDGTGDYIEADDQDIGNFGSADFTAEGWFYLTASPSNYITIAETRTSGGTTTGWVMAISAGDFYVYSGAFIGAKGSAISSNTWYHWAFTRSGTNQKVFLNGTQIGTTYTTVRNYTDNNFTIGAKHDASEFFTGYQSDVRITKGLARYTSNFTAPTAALKG